MREKKVIDVYYGFSGIGNLEEGDSYKLINDTEARALSKGLISRLNRENKITR
jgi:uncharacterized protein (DUF2249 family)